MQPKGFEVCPKTVVLYIIPNNLQGQGLSVVTWQVSVQYLGPAARGLAQQKLQHYLIKAAIDKAPALIAPAFGMS
jgi:hypothetical protein